MKSGRANFTQTVHLGQEGAKKRSSSGSIEFVRPEPIPLRLYQSPIEQLIVGDGQKVWIYDVDLNQVTVTQTG